MKRVRSVELLNFLDTVPVYPNEKNSVRRNLIDGENLKRLKENHSDVSRCDELTLSYIDELGFSKQLLEFKTYLSDLDKCSDESEVIACLKLAITQHICDNNFEFFQQRKDISYLSPSVCVDGTCGVGKSSLVRRFENNNDKISNHLDNIVARNSHVTSAISYFLNGLKLMNEKPYYVWDRTPYNNITWNRIWCIIVDVLSNRQAYSTGLPIEKKWLWKAYANSLHPVVAEQLARSAKTFLLVDSRDEIAHKRLYERGEASDRYRWAWPNYIKIQNYFYINFWQTFPSCYCLIDIAQYAKYFEDLDYTEAQYLHVLQECIAVLIEQTLQQIKNGNIPIERYEFQKEVSEKSVVCKSKTFINVKATDRESIRPLYTVKFTEGLKNFIKKD